jgi:hypothetical protein
MPVPTSSIRNPADTREKMRGMPFDTSCYTFMKNYLYATEEVIASTKTEGDFYYAMCQKFPQANLFISNEMNAGVFKGGKDWNWREDEVNVGQETARK